MTKATEPRATTAIICPNCERASTASIRGVAVWDGFDRDGNFLAPPTQWSFVQCDYCRGVAIQWREDYGEGFEADEPIVVYPTPRRLSHDIPRKLRAEWDEARTCFDVKAYKATVVMVRRTLEGACRLQGAPKSTLNRNIKWLLDEGKINSTLADWADLLRVLGNEGAHFTGNRVSREDAEDALDFAEALLDHLYVLRKRFDEFKARRHAEKDNATEKGTASSG